MVRFFFFLLWGTWAVLAQTKTTELVSESKTTQLMVVITESWEDAHGKLYCLQKTEKGWQTEGKPFEVSLGRAGLAWGKAKDEVIKKASREKDPVKKEGDGKSPAGLFLITLQLYGYEEKTPAAHWDYVQLKENLLGVDDVDSQYYNKIVDTTKVACDWNSYEVMRRKDHLYRWLLVIEHNLDPVTAGAGSCIFIHLWRSELAATAGCTAMTEENFLTLVSWLQPKNNPKILQVPQEKYAFYQKEHGLPNLD